MVQVVYGGKAGRSVNYPISPTLVAVRPTPNRDIGGPDAESRSLLRQLTLEAAFGNLGINVMDASSLDAGADTARSTFKSDDAFQFAGRVIVDPKSGEPIVYSEKLFVKLVDDAQAGDDGHFREVLRKLGSGWRVLRRVGYSKQAAVIVPTDEQRVGLGVFDEALEILEMSVVDRSQPELARRRSERMIFGEQWHIGPRQIRGVQIDAHAHVQDAWSYSRGAGATIAIIDDGVDIAHPEFSRVGKISAPWDAVNRTTDPRPRNRYDNHGTACAGVACASGVDGAAGVAPDAQLMPIRLSASLGELSEADAIYWAASHGADVISCSWGPQCGDWRNPDDPLHDNEVFIPDSTDLAIQDAVTSGRMGRGCVITWAAGNGNESVDLDGYASHPEVIAVAACNDESRHSAYSDFGDAIWCAFPSSDPTSSRTRGIWTTDRRGTPGYNEGNILKGDADGHYTAKFGGTSSACPGVAGVVALMIAANEYLSVGEIKHILASMADKIDAAGGNYQSGHSKYYGHGRVNAAKAVLEASRRYQIS